MTLQSIEIIAVVLNVAYVILAAYQKKICWFFGGLGSALSVYYFQHAEIRLYAEAWLYAFYVLVAIYGWWTWAKEDHRAILEWMPLRHLQVILLGVGLSLLLAYVTSHYTSAARPIPDSFTTIFGVIATFMTIRRVLSNWIYWMIIDVFSIWLYMERDSDIYAAQMLLFAILAAYGYYQWRIRCIIEQSE